MVPLHSQTLDLAREADTRISSKIFGSIEPRIFTPPLRDLTPETSYGFDVINFARDVLHEPLDPWQEWAVIHLGELLEDGRPRFRQVLVIVARQNGKTHLLRVLSLYWLFVEQWPLVAGTSTNRGTAKESWLKAVETAEVNPLLTPYLNGVRRANGEETLSALRDDGKESRYIIAASTRAGLRGFTVDRLILDELREHRTYEAWNAAVPTTNAKPNAQIIAISNQGDDESVVLNSIRDSAIKSIEDGSWRDNPREGLFEWSAPEGSDISDPNVWTLANPNLGYRLDLDAIKGPALRAIESGGAEEAGFMTEMLCIPVRALDAAVDPKKWKSAYVAGNLNDVASQTVWGFDVNRAGTHATLVAAAKVDDVVRVQVIRSWTESEMVTLVSDLTELLNRIKPRGFAWFPNGPGATYAAELRKARLAPRVSISELSGEVSAACMGVSEAINSGKVHHNDDDLLNAHFLGAQKLWSGDTWKFSRKGKGSSDAAYATAAAWMLATSIPPAPSYKFIDEYDEEEEG